MIVKVLNNRGEKATSPTDSVKLGDEVEGCDTPGRFATGCGGNFHGASQILNLTKEGIQWQNKRFVFV